MIWNRHSNLEGSHAFLSASKHTWLNKSDVDLIESYRNSFATMTGTMLHAYAESCIRFREKIRKGDLHGIKIYLLQKGVPEFAIDLRDSFPTLMRFVNDSIDMRMDPEVLLYYSDLCYGTTDAISYNKNLLRISDLKTGVTPVKMEQLLVYSGLFFLEYGFKPEKSRTELRIYQSDEVLLHVPEASEINEIMEGIAHKNQVLRKLKEV